MSVIEYIDTVIFDKDGTLLDFENTWYPAALATANYLSQDNEAKASQLKQIFGVNEQTGRFDLNSPFVCGRYETWLPEIQQILRATPFEEADIKMLANRVQTKMCDLSSKSASLLPDALDTLNAFQNANMNIALATNATLDSAVTQLTELDIAKYFSVIKGDNNKLKLKPEADMLTQIVNELGTSPQRALLVGDSVIDVIAAKRAGVTSIAVKTGPDATRLAEAEPDYLVESLSQVIEIVLPSHHLANKG